MSIDRNHLDLLCHSRPLRAGVLVGEIPGVPWQATWAGALSALTQVWGGSSAVLVPFGPHVPEELIWRAADVADPDWWTVYAPSYGDPADLPADRAEYWQEELKDAAAHMPPEELAVFEQEDGGQPVIVTNPPDGLLEMLVRRGGAVDTAKVMLARGPLTTGRVPYPMVDVTAFAKNTGALPRVRDPASSARPTGRLLQAAETGRLAPRLRQALVAAGMPPEVLPRLTELTDVYGQPPIDLPGPFALTEVGCSWFGRGTVDRSHITVVVGDRPEDFALAYLTRRTRTHAWWLPSDLDLAETRDAVRALAARHATPATTSSSPP